MVDSVVVEARPRAKTTAPASTLSALEPPSGRTPAAAASRLASAAPAAPAAPADTANSLTVKELVGAVANPPPLMHPIREMHRIIEPTYDRITRIMGQVLLAPLSFVRWAVSGLVNLVSMVLKVVLSFILELPLRLLGLFGVRVDNAISVLRKCIAAPFAVVTGVVEGALRAPEAVVGGGFQFLRDLFSFRYIREPRMLLSMFTQPVFSAIAGGLAPLYYGLRNLDDVIYPPRALTEPERRALSRDYDESTLDRARIHDRGIIRALTMWGDANTQGHDIYVDQPLTGAATPQDLRTLRHELVHTLQSDDAIGGFPVFLSQYYSEVIGQLPGRSLVRAYASVPQEVEAYSFQSGS